MHWGVVHAYVGRKVLKPYILRLFVLTDCDHFSAPLNRTCAITKYNDKMLFCQFSHTIIVDPSDFIDMSHAYCHSVAWTPISTLPGNIVLKNQAKSLLSSHRTPRPIQVHHPSNTI